MNLHNIPHALALPLRVTGMGKCNPACPGTVPWDESLRDPRNHHDCLRGLARPREVIYYCECATCWEGDRDTGYGRHVVYFSAPYGEYICPPCENGAHHR